jgi:hypothetical protein
MPATLTSPTSPEALRESFHPLLRRQQALQMGVLFGVSAATFKLLVPKGHDARRRVAGCRDHYLRDPLIRLFEQHAGANSKA